MKRILIILVLVLLLGCSQQEVPQDAPQKEVLSKPPLQEESSMQPTAFGVPSEIKDLIEKSKTRTKSLSYNYKGPEHETEIFKFYVREDRIKYVPPRALKSLDAPDAFDSVFIDRAAKTAAQYCDAASCKVRGKKKDLDYDDAYIDTPFDWVLGISSARKLGEEVLESRSTWKIDTNKGIVWIDNYYGIPMKVESDGNEYKFTQIAFNQVEDEEVIPSG